MPNSLEKTAVALAKAALNSQQASAPAAPAQPRGRKPRVSTGRAMLLGAGLVVAGQALVKTKGRDALMSVRHGLAERIDGTPTDALDALDEDERFDEQPEEEDVEYNDEPEAEAGEDDLADEAQADEEGATQRRRKAGRGTRGRS
jgi:hypothetical protein